MAARTQLTSQAGGEATYRMAVAVWARQASRGGSVRYGYGLSLIQRIGESLCYRTGPGVAMPRVPKESTRRLPGTPVAAENDIDWALRDIPGIS
jgi:hypothetical protein